MRPPEKNDYPHNPADENADIAELDFSGLEAAGETAQGALNNRCNEPDWKLAMGEWVRTHQSVVRVAAQFRCLPYRTRAALVEGGAGYGLSLFYSEQELKMLPGVGKTTLKRLFEMERKALPRLQRESVDSAALSVEVRGIVLQMFEIETECWAPLIR